MLQGVSNLISRSLKKKRKNFINWTKCPHKNNITYLNISGNWNFSNSVLFDVLSYLVPPPPESWKTAVLLWKLGLVKCRRHRRHFETKTFILRRLLNVAKPRVKFAARAAIHPARESLKRMQRTDQPCVICVLVVVSLHMKEKRER